MLSRARSAAALVAALLPVSLVSAEARAQVSGADGSNDAAGAEGAVALTVTGADDGALRDSIRELLARLRLVVVAPGDAGSLPLVARVQIDLTSPSDAVVVVLDGATGGARLHRSLPRDASTAIVREEIAHAVQSAVESALLAAREHVTPPPPPPPPLPVPVVSALPPPPQIKEEAPLPARPSPFGLEIMTLAGVGPIADASGPGTRIGMGGMLVSRGFLRPSLALSFLYAVPFDTGDVELSSHTSIASGRALAGIGLLRSKWIALDVGAGGGLDAITVAPHSGILPAANVDAQTTRVDALLSAMTTAQVALAPGVVFLLTAGVDVDLDSRTYVLSDGTSETALLTPWRVRPMALAGFGFTAIGDGHFAPSGGR